jgi:hypothetical protein
MKKTKINAWISFLILGTGYSLLAQDQTIQAPQKQQLPTLESYGYDMAYRYKAIIDHQPTAILVVAFNRPQYLARVIASLERNPESQTLPFYFFLDGGPHAKQQENIDLINASAIKNKVIISRPRNYGCPKNHIDAKRFLFDWCGFNQVIILEEDLEVSPSFIHINLALHQWAKKNFSNVGVVQCWSYCYLSKEEKLKQLNVVEDTSNMLWSFVGYCLDQEVWDNMKSILYTYELFVDQIPHSDQCSLHRSKPGKSNMAPSIRAWVKELMSKRQPPVKRSDKAIFPSNSDIIGQHSYSSDELQLNQDIMTSFALWMAGYIKIRTIVNRAVHIGEEGISTDKDNFQSVFMPIKLDCFASEDFSLQDFTISHTN